MPKIFISYRREDSSGYAGRLHERLSTAFGANCVFMDLEGIKPGVDFEHAINKAVGSCDILIVLIGKQWLTITDATGRRRIDDPQDFVRLEIATALNRNVGVIPVLVRQASMPVPQELPEPLANMARRQAHELSDDRWDFDVGQLVKALGGGSVSHKIRRIWYRWRRKIFAFLGFTFVFFLLLLYFTSGAVNDAERFLALVAKGDLHAAYLLTASAAQDLENAFRSLIDAQTEFSEIKEVDAIFDEVPAIDDDGILVISGYFSIKQMNLKFDMRYLYEHPEWKLAGVWLSTGGIR